MYDELVKRLRELQAITEHCGEQTCFECTNKELCDKHDNKTLSGNYKEGADAIEELGKRAEKYEKQVDYLFELVNDKDNEIDVLNVSLETYQGLAEAMQNNQLPRWIPVTERLPEDDGFYVCFVENKNKFIDIFRFDVDEGEFFVKDLGDIVTRWMPLPEPPKEERE